MKNFKNKIVLVIGATRGIGKAIALKLSNLDYFVIGVYEKSDNLALKIEKNNPNIKFFKADISQESEIKKIINFIRRKYNKLDILINNAGINIGGKIKDYSLSDWNRIFAVNLTSKFLLSKYLISMLSKSSDGQIINISSRGGINEYAFSEFIPYCVTNAGINNFTVALAKELKSNKIRVNAVIPTVTETDRFKSAFTKNEQKEIRKAGKLGTSQEIADLVLSLIRDNTKNGEILIDKRVYIETKA